MTDLVIRQAAPEDAEAIFEIENLCFPDPWSLESIRYELEENPAAFYVVAVVDEDSDEDAGLLVGYAGIWWIHEEGHITNVAVRPGYRNRRIGSHILETLLDHTKKEGIRDYTLEVRRSNDPARALYEKFGFCVEGVRKGYYRYEKEDALILWKHENSGDGHLADDMERDDERR